MNDTARVLLTAALLSSSAITVFAWRVTNTEYDSPARLIGELRLAQWGAILLAGVGAVPVGLAVANPDLPNVHFDATLGVIFVILAGLTLQRDPHEALLVVSGAFVLHALANLTHRPGWLPADLAPQGYTIGCAMFDVYLAGLIFWARRR